MEQRKYIGKRTASKEAPRQVIGRGRFIDDLVLPRMLQAFILRSPYGHANITSSNAEKASKLPGVVGIVTPDDIVKLTRPFKPGRYAAGLRVPIPEYCTAVGKTRYIGEPVAMVAADTRPRAEDAIDAVEIEYEPLQAVTSAAAATDPSAPLLYEELGSNVAWTGHVEFGDTEKAFASADRIVKENLKIHRYSSTPLEPFAMIAEATADKVTVYCNSQSPDVIYDALTEALGISNIRVIVPDIGGAFGQKIHLIRKYAVLTAVMAMKVGRPVKWIEDRSEHMMAGGHSCDQEFDVEAAVKNNGEVIGMRILDTDDVGGTVSTLTIHFTNKLNNLFNTYRCQNMRLEGRSVLTNKCPVVPNRGIGKPGMCFIWERMIDRVGQALGIDPIEVRRRNLIQPGQFPYTTPNGNIYGSGDYETLLNKALKNVDYEAVRARQKAEREKTNGKLIGISVVVAVEPGGRNAARDMAIFPTSKNIPGAGGVEGATVKLERSGSVTFTLGATASGQSHETTASQIVGDVLNLSPERVASTGTFDSATSPWGVSSASSGNNFHLYDVGAVHGASVLLRKKILTLAAHVLDVDEAALDMEDGVIFSTADKDKKLTYAELGKIAYTNQALIPEGLEPGMQVTFYFKNPHANPLMLPDLQGRVRAQYTFSSAAHAAVVEVDRDTGRVKVLRYVIVSDMGTLLNPSVVDGQVYGSAAHGISVALGEGFVYGPDGQLLTLTLLDYGKSTTAETPHIEVEHHSIPDPFTTFGQKAAGEGAAIPSPAAIAGAVEDALAPLGVKIRHLPLPPETVWRLIQDARSQGAA